VAIQSDDRNCGSCGNRCAEGESCHDGQSQSSNPQGCPPGSCCEDNQLCNGDGRCRGGQCQPRPTCRSNGESFPQGDGQCCSENVNCQVEATHVVCTCLPAELGNACLVDGDCRSGRCVGYQCVGCPMGLIECEGQCVSQCPPCTRATCRSLGKDCGSWPDGCGGTVRCGSCDLGATPSCNNGTCASCVASCPGNCGACIQKWDGSTTCTDGFNWLGGCPDTCDTDADCPAGWPICAVSYTANDGSNVSHTFAEECGANVKLCIHIAECFD
jgi:hypothetical protein